ncbi:cation:proton antiporter [Thiohalorhabdus sp.]|uniref:cation:proton antiporter n=3 Tax=Thiohalorhabdus sp. TaxID=3094134 RepID=UPI002FC3C88A
MANVGVILIILGALLLLGLFGDLLARRIPVPRVTLLILFGVAIGASGLALLPARTEDWYPLISNIALLMVGFLLGGKLSVVNFRQVGKNVLGISLFKVAGVALFVLLGLLLIGVPPAMALVLAGIGPATAPAAVSNVVEELGGEGKFTETLLGIVAIDDAWGLIAFSLLLAVAQTMAAGADGSALGAIQHGAWDLGGALVLGLAVGVPAAFVTGRLRPGEPTQAEALGVVLLAGGLALWLEVSYLLTALTVGATIVNLASHHEQPFHEIEYIEWPFMILFFLLAGASLHVEALAQVGVVGGAYIALRALGLVTGSFVGGHVIGAAPRIRRWMGWATLPQAGVALGMALVAGNQLPEVGETVLPLVVGTTVVFELLGPVLTRLALIRAGEASRG